MPKVALAFFVSFFPMVVNVAAGLSNTEEDMIRMARAFSASKWKVFKSVRFPSALPYFSSGMKIAMALSIVGIIVAEFVVAQEGLGYLVVFSQGMMDTPLMMAVLLVLAVLGVALFGFIVLLERFFVYWGPQEG